MVGKDVSRAKTLIIYVLAVVTDDLCNGVHKMLPDLCRLIKNHENAFSSSK